MRTPNPASSVTIRQAVRSRLKDRGCAIPASDLRPPTSRRGLTLIELLVVIIILTTLVSAAIPILAPTNDDRRLREASRSVNSFISAAQMKAVQLQRPYGVAIKRLATDTNPDNPNASHDDNAVSVELFHVEQPAPYTGFDRTSAVCVARHPTQLGLMLIQFVVRGTTVESPPNWLPPGWDADPFPPGMFRPGDVIEIDGTRYALQGVDQRQPTNEGGGQVNQDKNGFYVALSGRNVIIVAKPINDTGQMLNPEFDSRGRPLRDPVTGVRLPPYWTNPAPYKILRQPMPTSDEPLQLPEGTAIDLRASGQTISIKGSPAPEASGFFYNLDAVAAANRVNNADAIIVMFTPEGAVERVRFNEKNVATGTPAVPAIDQIFDGRTTANLYLLVGRRENAPPPALGDDPTLDASNYSSTTTEVQRQEYKEALNWLRSESRWIVIGSQSGRVVTAENAFVDPQQFFDTVKYPNDSFGVRRARQINAAREFAREMTQIGGR